MDESETVEEVRARVRAERAVLEARHIEADMQRRSRHHSGLNSDDLWVEYEISLLDKLDPLGAVTAITLYGHEPTAWSVRVRPEGVAPDRVWGYEQIGEADTLDEGLDLLRRHVTS